MFSKIQTDASEAIDALPSHSEYLNALKLDLQVSKEKIVVEV